MTTNNELDNLFEKAFQEVSKIPAETLPQDQMLRLYAYYKQAHHGSIANKEMHLSNTRDAFKLNAWLQISHISKTQAKQNYIELVNQILNKQ